jgi:hypothetical protein
MADTLDQIYMNTSLGGTEFDSDGEHTLLTTDANTSYVIKDMNVINTSSFTDTNLELNGFSVGSLSSNATGSLIIPPSSTLKIKTTDYPLKVYEQKTAMSINTNGTVVQKEYFDKSGNSVGTTQLGYTGNATTLNTQVRDIDLFTTGSNTYVVYVTTDGNSSHTVQQVLAQDYNQSASSTEVVSTSQSGESYHPYGIMDHETYGPIAVNLTNAGNLQYHTLGDTVATVTPSSWNSGSITNGSYDITSSSYPQAYIDHNYFWYFRNSSLATYLYAINMTTGNQLRFQMASLGMNGERPFAIAYRASDDRFIYYSHHNNSNWVYKIFKKTKTQIDAVTANTNYSPADSFIEEGERAHHNTPNITYVSSRELSYDKDGNIGVQDTQAHVRFQSPDGTYLGASSDLTDITFSDGQTHSSDSRVFFRRYKPMTSAAISSQGITSPSFGIQLLGIKNV